MKVIGYIRVSTDEQARGGVSLAAQEAKVRGYCDLYDLDLLTVIIDPGASAKNLKREGLQSVLTLLRSGKASGLIVAKLDRLTRSVSDMDYLISNFFGDRAKHNASLFSVADQVDTRTAAGRLVLHILMSVAQWEREAIGERTRDALAHKKANRQRISRRVPYGWSLDADGVNLSPCQAEQETAEIARDLKLRGRSLRAIGRELQSIGTYQRNGKPWHPSSVKSLLSSEIA